MTAELSIVAVITLAVVLKLAWNCRLCKAAAMTGDDAQKERFCRKAICKS